MPDIQNPSFEVPGLAYGEASDWTEAQSAGAEDIALFDDSSRPVPHEGFNGGWSSNQNYQLSFGVGDLAYALFESDSHQQEDFEMSWRLPSVAATLIWNNKSVWVYSSSNFEYATFNAAGTPTQYDSFEQRWPVGQVNPPKNGFTPATVPGVISLAKFNTGVDDQENFEKNWQVNQDYEQGFAPLVAGGGTIDPAMFDAGANAYENFEGVWVLTLA